MKKFVITLAVFSALITSTAPVLADACSSRARQLASSMNANVISVQSGSDASGKLVCVAKMKINSPGKPSRIVTKKFRP